MLLQSLNNIEIYQGAFDIEKVDSTQQRDEPLADAIAILPSSYIEFIKYLKQEINKLSVYAVDKNTDKIIAIGNVDDLVDMKYNTEVRGMNHIIQLWKLTSATYNDILKDEDHVLHFTGLTVSPEYRKSGLGSKIVGHIIDVAKRNGYRYIVTESTSEFSYKIFVKYGFKEVLTVGYDDIDELKGRIKEPHKYYRAMLLKIDL